MKDAETSETRRKRASVLRSIRSLDRPLAQVAIRRWRNSDEMTKAVVDQVLYGSAFVTIKRVDPASVVIMPDGSVVERHVSN